MSNMKSRQTADKAQKGPGFTPVQGRRGNTAPGIGSAGNTKTGSSQSNKRGKQGNG